MLNRFVVVVILAPIAIVLIAFAVANRGAVALTLDPFNPGNPALTYNLPLFVVLFGALALGLVIGGMACWLTQGRYRRLARERKAELASVAKDARKSQSASSAPRLAQQ